MILKPHFLLVFFFLLAVGCEKNDPVQVQEPSLYIAENGITVKASESAKVGEHYMLDGKEYLVVDRRMLDELIAEKQDITRVVTSKVTDMSRLFRNWRDFNQDIGSWDVSQVTNMSGTFMFCDVFNQNNVRSIRPSYGLPVRNFDHILGKKAKVDINEGTPLSWELINL